MKKKAIEWTQKAIKKGDVIAYSNLGYFYSHGIGVPIDFKKVWNITRLLQIKE